MIKCDSAFINMSAASSIRGGWSKFSVVMGLLLAACQAGPVALPTPSLEPSPTPSPPAPTATVAPDPVLGAQLYRSVGCARCHGPNAEGGVNPTLAGTRMSYTAFVRQVRMPRAEMEPFPAERVSDQELAHIYAWLQSLPRPTPTPGA